LEWYSVMDKLETIKKRVNTKKKKKKKKKLKNVITEEQWVRLMMKNR